MVMDGVGWVLGPWVLVGCASLSGPRGCARALPCVRILRVVNNLEVSLVSQMGISVRDLRSGASLVPIPIPVSAAKNGVTGGPVYLHAVCRYLVVTLLLLDRLVLRRRSFGFLPALWKWLRAKNAACTASIKSVHVCFVEGGCAELDST